MLDPLTLDQMRVLVAISETGSFSAAARRLGRAQSAVSQSVRAMETALGLSLFDRSARIPRMTPEADELLPEAMLILRDVAGFQRRAEGMARGLIPELSLAVDQVFPVPLLMDCLEAYRQRYPMIPVTLFTEGLGATEQCLRSRQARLGIYSPTNASSGGLEIEFLSRVSIVPVVASGHPLAAAPGLISRRELRRHVQLVLTDRSQSVSGVALSTQQWRFADQYSRLEHLLRGFGWSFAPRHLVRSHLDEDLLKILRLEEYGGASLGLPLYAVREKGTRLDESQSWFLTELRNRIAIYGEAFLTPEEALTVVPYPLEPAPSPRSIG